MPKKNNNFPEQYVLANLTNFPKPALYVDFSNNPSDMSINQAVVEYESQIGYNVESYSENVGPNDNSIFNYAEFSNLRNKRALIDYGDADPQNPLSFGVSGTGENRPFTVSFWFQTRVSQTFYGLFSYQTRAYTDDSGAITCRYYSSTKTYEFVISSDTVGRQLICTCTPDSGRGLDPFETWTHVTITYDGTNTGGFGEDRAIKFFINGEEINRSGDSFLVNNVSSFTHSPQDPTRLFVGGWEDGDDELSGYMSQFMWFSTALDNDQINQIYNGQLNNFYSSGRLSNPSRTIIREQDAWSGKYPTVHRMNRKGTSGILSNILFDDAKTVKFGTRIYDNFDIKDYEVYTKEVNGDVWEVSEGVIIKREFDPNEINSASTGAVVLAGEGDSDGRWIQTKNKISMPTVYLDVLRGPYNDQGGLLGSLKLGLVEGGLNETLFIQAKTEGGSWENITIEESFIGSDVNSDLLRAGGLNAGSFLFGVNIDQQNSLTSQVKKDNRPVMSLKIPMEAFAKAGFTSEPFYLRIAQSQVNSASRNVWAIGKIDIISRDEQVTYPALNKGVTADLFHLSQKIASPNIVSYLTTTGSAIEGITDSEYSFIDSSLEQKNTPFDELLVTNYQNNEFHRVGTDPNVLPGFDLPLLDKTKISITLSASSETRIGLVYPPPKNTLTSYQNMMCYYNFKDKIWDLGALQGPQRFGQTFDDMIVSSSIGFGSLNPIGESSSTTIGTPTIHDNFQYNGDFFVNSSVRPTNAFGFPSHVKFAPEEYSGQTIKASELGITKPFLLEKIKMSFDASMQFADIEDGGTSNQYYSLEFMTIPGSNYQVSYFENTEVYIPTFFILRNFKDSLNVINNVQKIDQSLGSVVENFDFNINIPDSRYIWDRTTGLPDTYNDYVTTNRELITYGQFSVYRSGSEENNQFIRVEGDTNNYTLIDAPFSDNVLNSLTRDSKILTITSSINSLDLNQHTIEFPCRSPIISQNVFSTFDSYEGAGNGNTVILNSENGKTIPVLAGSSRNVGSAFTPNLVESDQIEINVSDGLTERLTKTSIVSNPNEFDRPAPYLILPEDELIFGWQYPLPRQAAAGISSGDDVNDEFAMTLKGITNIEFFGSQIRNGKEFHEGINQNLTSNAIHEVIGSDSIIDQWQVNLRGEMTGSLSDQFMFGNSQNATPDSFSLGSIIIPENSLKNNFVTNERQSILFEGTKPVNRINARYYRSSEREFGNLSILGNTYEFLTAAGANENVFNNLDPAGSWTHGINRFINISNYSSTFKDSNVFNLRGPSVSNKVDSTYGSSQNFTRYSLSFASSTVVKLGGYPKYYYGNRHYGHLADSIRQGLDGNFETNLTIQNRNNDASSFVVTSPAVKTQFVSSEYDNADLNFRIFKKTKPEDINGSSYISYQSSNLDEFSRSFKPFYDDGIVLNREYGEDTITVTI